MKFNPNIKEFFRRIKYELKGNKSIFFDHVADSFYEFHQNRLRGDETMIKEEGEDDDNEEPIEIQENEGEIRKFDRFRILRNDSVYSAKPVNSEDAKTSFLFAIDFINKVKLLLN